MSQDKIPKHPSLEEPNADSVYYANPESVPGNQMPPNLSTQSLGWRNDAGRVLNF